MRHRLLGNQRQHAQDGKVGQGGVGGDTCGQFTRLAHAFSLRGHVVHQPDGVRFGGTQHVAGEHHFGHAGEADQFGDPHRSAATEKNAALAFGQAEISAFLGNTHMRRGRQLKPATHHRPLHDHNHGQPPELDFGKGFVPQHRVLHALTGIGFG